MQGARVLTLFSNMNILREQIQYMYQQVLTDINMDLGHQAGRISTRYLHHFSVDE